MTYTYLKCVWLISSPLNHGSLKVGRDPDAPSPPGIASTNGVEIQPHPPFFQERKG